MDFPKSNNTVRVRMIDTTSVMTIKAESFVQPVQQNHELINITDVAFLIENDNMNQKVLFDLGVRKDYWNLPAVIQKRLGVVIPSMRVDKDTSEILQQQGVELKTINSIIWSHYHWDHTGNVSLFPTSTSITVGPGFKSSPTLLPGFPDLPTSPVSASDFANRTLSEVDFATSPLSIGDLPAHDYFGDGSFYLLDTPGHCLGHMCGLARTTPSTFIFMGGDICHFVGDFRPNAIHPLPDPIPSSQLDKSPYFPSPCPCSLFTDHHPRKPASEDDARSLPWYELSHHPKTAYDDTTAATSSVSKMQKNFDESDDVLVCIAHDTTLPRVLPTINKNPTLDLNEWQVRGFKEKTHWGWLNELPRDDGKRPGREPIVEGFWRDGKRWDRAKEELTTDGEEREERAKRKAEGES